MSRISYFLRGLKKVLLHTYVVAGRRLLKNTVFSKMGHLTNHIFFRIYHNIPVNKRDSRERFEDQAQGQHQMGTLPSQKDLLHIAGKL